MARDRLKIDLYGGATLFTPGSHIISIEVTSADPKSKREQTLGEFKGLESFLAASGDLIHCTLTCMLVYFNDKSLQDKRGIDDAFSVSPNKKGIEIMLRTLEEVSYLHKLNSKEYETLKGVELSPDNFIVMNHDLQGKLAEAYTAVAIYERLGGQAKIYPRVPFRQDVSLSLAPDGKPTTVQVGHGTEMDLIVVTKPESYERLIKRVQEKPWLFKIQE